MWGSSNNAVVNPNATKEEIENVIKSGNAEQLFVQATIDRKEAAKAALQYIKVNIFFQFILHMTHSFKRM
jgi:t-SNARE complex subunit (syntaxin)